jgi:protein BCP1
LLKLIFEFENVNISGVADLIINQREEVGTVIKTEDEEETKSNDVATLALITMISLHKDKDSEPVKQIINFINEKVNTYLSADAKEMALKIMQSCKVGFVVNERAVNLPMELVPPMFNLHIEDIDAYKHDYNGDTKYDADYLVMLCKFVKQKVQPKKAKKVKTESTEQNLYYKYEEEYFVQHADICLTYKIPYEQKFSEFNENTNEPQYFSLIFIRTEKFLEVVNLINKN